MISNEKRKFNRSVDTLRTAAVLYVRELEKARAKYKGSMLPPEEAPPVRRAEATLRRCAMRFTNSANELGFSQLRDELK